MDEDRLIDLETRLAYADDALRVLSDTVARQQQQIERLEALCRQLVERVKAQGESDKPFTPAEEVPPHW